jgi:hypothetical protein
MARTKTKRRRKHRGTQAGTIVRPDEARGRGTEGGGGSTDRAAAREEARRRRAERLDRPPTWRSAVTRAAIAAGLVAILAVVALKNTVAQAVILAAIMLVIYVPLGYGFDTVVYRMRQRRKQRGSESTSGTGRDGRGR